MSGFRLAQGRRIRHAMNMRPAAMILFFLTFVLAIFLGVELISKVPSQLHTPLMSGSNAISGITIVGALVAAGADRTAERLGHRAWASSPWPWPRSTWWAATWSPTACWPCSSAKEEEVAQDELQPSSNYLYIARRRSVHYRPEDAQPRRHRRARQHGIRRRHADRHRGHAAADRQIVELPVDRRRHLVGGGHRRRGPRPRSR